MGIHYIQCHRVGQDIVIPQGHEWYYKPPSDATTHTHTKDTKDKAASSLKPIKRVIVKASLVDAAGQPVSGGVVGHAVREGEDGDIAVNESGSSNVTNNGGNVLSVKSGHNDIAVKKHEGHHHNESQIAVYHRLMQRNHTLQEQETSQCVPCPIINTTIALTTVNEINNTISIPTSHSTNTGIITTPNHSTTNPTTTSSSSLFVCCNNSLVNIPSPPPLPTIPYRKADVFFRGDLDMGLDCSPGARVRIKELHRNLTKSNHTLKDRVYIDGTKGEMKDAYFALW